METKNEYPTEVISLPSEGYLYPADNVLSSGKIELKYMTAKEEDILTSRNLISKGLVLEKLLESVIVSPGVDVDSLLLGDKNAIFIATRIMGYGSKYEVKITCPRCGKTADVSVDISKLDKKKIDLSTLARGKNEFSIILPASKKNAVCKFLTHGDEKNIDTEISNLKKMMAEQKAPVEPEMSTRLKYVIKSIDGNSDNTFIRKFVDSMLSLDSKAIRDKMVQLSPDINTNIDFQCSDTVDCNYQGRLALPIGVSFFWPTT